MRQGQAKTGGRRQKAAGSWRAAQILLFKVCDQRSCVGLGWQGTREEALRQSAGMAARDKPDMNLNKSLSLREIADATKRASAQPRARI